MKWLLLMLCGYVATNNVNAQQLDELNRKNLIKINGNMNVNTTTFLSDLSTNQRDPFAWYASGTLNISVAGIAFPFTYSISNQGRKYAQPSNLTSINPSYKWVKTHIGRVSASFSPYTVSGINYSGAGVELTPKKFGLHLFYGQINKAVEYDAIANNLNGITYRRWAFGLQLSGKIKQMDLKYTSLKAWDDPLSIDFVPGGSSVKPKDNFVNSIQVRSKLGKAFDFETELAASLLTNNRRYTEPISGSKWYKFMYPMVDRNGSTSVYYAMKTGVNYQFKTFRMGVNYERIDPGYQTLGGLFFNNDMENYTLTPTLSLWGGKLNITANTGLQKNNLSNDKAAETKRWVGSINVAGRIGSSIQVNAGYSNFSSFTRNNPQRDPFTNQITYLDTANVYQISESYNANINYGFGKINKSAINATFSRQTSANITGILENALAFGIRASGTGTPANTYSSTIAYNLAITKSKLSFTLSSNANYTENQVGSTLFIGPTFNVSKNWGKNKPALTGGITYNRNYQAAMLNNNVFNYRASFSYSPKWIDEKLGSVNFSLSGTFLHKLPVLSELKSVHELTIIANIAYNFK